jgi:hypothetical protein
MVAGSFITEKEVCLYNKWLDIFKGKIKERYGHIHNDAKIQKLAQENARYLITIFMPTQMIYSTSLRQINYIASWMEKYIKESSCDNDFEENLIVSMKKFIGELERLNVLEEGLLRNEKDRGFSLIASNLEKREDYFDYIYDVTYKGSLAEVAHAHRHRTLDYKIRFLDKKEYFVPPIIAKDDQLLKSWLEDMESVKDVVPQGELVLINECGKYEDFILKCKERLCSAAQVEIMSQTRNNLLRYKETLESKNHPLAKDIAKYCRGARCTFPGFKCSQDCGFKEGKTLEREV